MIDGLEQDNYTICVLLTGIQRLMAEREPTSKAQFLKVWTERGHVKIKMLAKETWKNLMENLTAA